MPVHHLVRRFDLDVDEPRGRELVRYSADAERARDAPHVGTALRAILGREVVVGHHVADPDAAARPEHPGASRAITAGLSVDRLITQFEITTSTLASGSGTSSI